MAKRYLVFGSSLLILLFYSFGFAQDIVGPCVAGTFYPQDKKQLSQMVEDFIDKATPEPFNGNIFALVSPHAGYGYSGQVAGFGYKLIKDKPYKTVIVIGTGHHHTFDGASVYPEGLFKTPLGEVEVDKEFTRKLLNIDPEVIFDNRAFIGEHSVEVQLPFLQKTLRNFKVVPIVFGDCSLSTCKNIALLLKEAIGTRKDVLVVVSTDLYHGYDYEEDEKIDGLTLKAIQDLDAESLYYGLRDQSMQACGGFGLVTTLMLAKQLKHDKVKVLKHTNSAQVTGKKIKGIWTVGYASCAIDSPDTNSKEKNMLNEQQKRKLLEIARSSLLDYLKTGKKQAIKEDDPALKQVQGAFVTLREDDQLRGCIGSLIGTEPLYLTVQHMAIESGTRDPRFAPVKLSELKNIDIEISVLSPMEKINDPGKIRLGEHGVMVRRGFNSGVFLPQVATETGWSKEEFMSNLCAHKAGLPEDAWKDKGTDIYIFSADVFSEKEFKLR